MTEDLIMPEDTIEVSENSTNVVDDLEADFAKFAESHSDMDIPQIEESSSTEDPTEIDLSDADSFKLQIFLSLCFALLDGLHAFIYGFISKYKLMREDIALDESDKAGLEIYFRTQKVMNIINRLPVEVIGFLHIEYMYFNKFQEFNKRMKEQDADELRTRVRESLEEQQEEEEQEPEELEEPEEIEEIEEPKPVIKRAPRKKAKPKKAAKKAAAKKKAEQKPESE